MDDLPIGILFACLVLLIFLSAFFSASETATMALNRYRLADQANKKNRKAMLLQNLINEPDQLLGTILLGNNLVNNAIVAISTMIAWQLHGETGVAVATGIITVVIVVFAEIPPKTYAAVYPERIAYFASYFLQILHKLLFPFVWLVSAAVRFFELIIPIDDRRSTADPLNSDQLKVAVEASSTDISKDQRDLLLGVLDLGSYSVESVMVPHNRIQAVDLEDDLQDIVELIKEARYSRLPVYEKSFKQIRGELDVREFLQKFNLREITKRDIEDELRKPLYVPDDAGLLEQIQRMQDENRNMSIIVDEYGEVMGVATLRDMLEEVAGIVGSQIEQQHGIIPEDGGTYIVNARLNVRDLNRILSLELPTGEIHTLNGLILELNEDIPSPGTTILLNGYPVETIRVSETAVELARISPRTKDYGLNLNE